MRNRRAKISQALLIALGSTLLVSLFFLTGALAGWQKRFTDLLFVQRAASDEIVIAAIDDASLAQLGRWPWDRRTFAQLIRLFSQAQVKLVAFDVNFSEEGPGDQQLAAAIREAGNVILPVEAEKLIWQGAKWEATYLIEPLPSLRRGAQALAHVNITPDPDNIVRQIPSQVGNYEAFGTALGQALNPVAQLPPGAKLRINFTGPTRNFQYLSVSELVGGKELDRLKDKIVLIGATAADLHDTHLTPTSRGEPMPGVELHANLAQTVAEGSFLREQDRWSTLLMLASLALLTLLIVWSLRPLWALVAAALLALLYFGGNLILYERNFLGNVFYGLLLILITFIAAMAWRYLSETKERERTVKIFSKYVAPTVVNKILAAAKEDVVPLGGTKETVTVLFADIRNFTPAAEKLGPEEVVTMLNEYLRTFAESIFRHEGTLDKFVGDEVMALFNTPLSQPDHVQRAMRCALDALRQVEKLQQMRPDLPRVQFGVGIHSGEAIIGNIGSPQRLDFTAVGRTVNLASRLTGIANEGQIIVSRESYERAKNDFAFRRLEPVKVKGIEEPVEIYELVR